MSVDPTPSMSREPIYLFEPSDEERRLIAQARLFDPLTERLFRQAGMGPGMRVLDLGCGVGDTAMLAARIVGPRGSVVGLDRSAARLAAARARAAAARLENVEFKSGDVLTPPARLGRFDAVVGRLILMYVADPAAVLRAAAGRLRPGGLLCFQEVDATFAACHPSSEQWEQMRTRFVETAAHAEVDIRMGLRLFPSFVAAGLPEPDLRLEAAIAGGAAAPAFAWTDVFSSMLPLMERFGTATVAEVDPRTLEERLLADVTASGGVVVAPLLIGAWTRIPGGVSDASVAPL